MKEKVYSHVLNVRTIPLTPVCHEEITSTATNEKVASSEDHVRESGRHGQSWQSVLAAAACRKHFHRVKEAVSVVSAH